jgi:hypothetical protein
MNLALSRYLLALLTDVLCPTLHGILFTIFMIRMRYLTELLGFGLFPSSGILETRKQDVSETGSVSVL